MKKKVFAGLTIIILICISMLSGCLDSGLVVDSSPSPKINYVETYDTEIIYRTNEVKQFEQGETIYVYCGFSDVSHSGSCSISLRGMAECNDVIYFGNETHFDNNTATETEYYYCYKINTLEEWPVGTYTFDFTITDKDTLKVATDSTTFDLTKKIYSPNALIKASTTKGAKPLSVSFTGSGDDSDGSIQYYNWDFGDGTTSNKQNPVHTFRYTGTYTVTLVVTDDDGATGKDTIEISVQTSPPSASASANPTSGEASLRVYFEGSATDSDGTIVSYHWDFGDGETSELQNPTHRYSDAGTYTATLTVTDNEGAKDTDTIKITVNEKSPPKINYELTVLDVRDWYPYYDQIDIQIRIDTDINFYLNPTSFWVKTETGSRYYIDKISKGVPDMIGAGSSYTFWVIFEMPEIKVVHLYYADGSKNLDAPVPDY